MLAATTAKAKKPATPELVQVKQRVENILNERKLTAKWLYERVGMTKEGWSNMMKEGSMKVSVLVRIAQALHVDMGILLGEGEAHGLPMASEPSAAYKARPRYLEDRVDLLERELHDLKKLLHKR